MSPKQYGGWTATKARLVHGLFVALFVLTQVGIVVADNGMTGSGGP